jgi:hypothetical protein
MSSPLTPQSILQQIAAIERFEQGKLCILRHGPNGPYYNLQRWENGANVSQYVPADQVTAVQENLAAYEEFQKLMQAYVQLLSARSREERLAGVKKKRPQPPTSSSRRKPKSKR